MLFNSAIFIIFAAVFFGLWPLLKRHCNTRWFYLVVASFFFYGWWDWRFLFLIVGSGLIDYFSGLAMAKWPQRRKLLLILSILGNIGSLAVFKYSGFVADNLMAVGEMLGYSWELKDSLPRMMLVTPVGISFYTFQSMSYTIDIYRGKLKPTRNILHFFAYLSLFPQLVAGPIVRAADLLPQLKTTQPVSERERFDALKMICRGFFKKMVVADNLAKAVNEAFNAPSINESALFWWIIVMLFAFQIYCDFSGYSDIAIGLGKWMGYDFPTNFNHPYISTSMREFWERWHISLSTWFRDYVYIPLGGSRCARLRAHLNMWITMVVSGLWHGAAWPFVIWGAMHAGFLSLERETRWPDRVKKLPGGRHLALLGVWIITLVSWVMFRCGNLDPEKIHSSRLARAGGILRQMFGAHDLFQAVPDKTAVAGFFHNFRAAITNDQAWEQIEGTVGMVFFLMILRQLYFHLKLDQRTRCRIPPNVLRLLEPIGYAVVIACCVYFRGKGAAFIYFQF